MALRGEVPDEDTIDILKDSFDNVKIKAAMPANQILKRKSKRLLLANIDNFL